MPWTLSEPLSYSALVVMNASALLADLVTDPPSDSISSFSCCGHTTPAKGQERSFTACKRCVCVMYSPAQAFGVEDIRQRSWPGVQST
jgi:hypothetical protein